MLRLFVFGISWFQAASCESRVGFSTYKAYIVETSVNDEYVSDICFNRIFKYYASVNITVNTGINFK